ncbi:hypothetical protein ACM61V_22505 [Sphingomonas sp. TX0543]|uniref:hypothetical protein n=1 Tax=Sphingomonas sp. TX0543 TaxID=3399682 RepID=UPI003AFA6ABC
MLLAELVHGASQIRRAVATALLHHLPVQPHFLAFVAPALPYPYPQTVVALSFDDIMLTIDAIHHRIKALERRLGTLESTARTPSSCNARSIISSAARKRLMRHPRPPR